MALGSTIIRFKIDLSDVDRGLYEKFELRVAMHPSEAAPFLITRVIAYALNLQEGIEFTQGISTPDEPAIYVKDLTGLALIWIDIGNPSPKRLHKASKAARAVKIYTHRDPKILLEEMEKEEIHKREAIEIYSLPPKFLSELEPTLARDNSWEMLITQSELSITVNGKSYHCEIASHRI